MATNTYVALDKSVVVGTSTTSVQFNGISSAYTNLRVVISGGSDFAAAFPYVIVNNDTGNNYSGTSMIAGTGGTFTERNSNQPRLGNFSVAFSTSLSGIYTIDFFKYTTTSKYRTQLWRMNCQDTTSGYSGTGSGVTMWRNNAAAISSLDFRLTNSGTDRVWKAGTTFTLYGILAEAVTPAPKATGGAIYSDSLYYYHVFGSTGVFAPTTSIIADTLVIAGGAGGGNATVSTGGAGGGGAGGVQLFSAQSLTATNYTVTVGAGGNSQSNGGNSQFGALTASVGGGAGGNSNGNGASGGSGGGGGWISTGQGTGGAGTSGQGYAGGNGGSSGYGGGGGGGAAGVGIGGSVSSGFGGPATNANAIWVNAVGFGVNGYYAGGGGAGSSSGTTATGRGGGGGAGGGGVVMYSSGDNAIANTGSGGGGAGDCYPNNTPGSGGKGGSGIVIVRYLKA